MKRFLFVILDIISFGVLPLLRWLLRHKKSTIRIDINRDGIPDVEINFDPQEGKK